MGGHFSWLPSFKGAKGGDPPKKFQFFFTKSCQNTISLKSEKHYHVLYAKNNLIIISARGGAFEIGLTSTTGMSIGFLFLGSFRMKER